MPSRRARQRRGSLEREPAAKRSKRSPQKDIPKHLSRRLRNHRAGHQGPDRHQGPAHHDEYQPRRALPRADAVHRPERHFAQDRDPKERERLRKILRELDVPGRHGRHHAHRRAKASAPVISCATSGCCSSNGRRSRSGIKDEAGSALRVSGAGSDRAHRARFPHRGNRRR